MRSLDYIKTYSINFVALAISSAAIGIEAWLKVILLALTVIWTAIKIRNDFFGYEKKK